MSASVDLERLKLGLLDLLNPVSFRAVSVGDGTITVEQAVVGERREGRDWPYAGTTMVGTQRLDNLHDLLLRVSGEGVVGDVIETGVWRGGAMIFARAILDSLGEQRTVWLCDSFEGLPEPDPAFPADDGDLHHLVDFLAVERSQVEAAFRRFCVDLEGVRFVEGWFRDTLPDLRQGREWALIRLDGDMYESTMIALENLYPNLSDGGFVIVDDYGAVEGCREATDDFRHREGIKTPIEQIDWTGIYWQRSPGTA